MKWQLIALDSQYIHSNLALRYLKTALKNAGEEVIFQEFSTNQNQDEVLNSIMTESCDLLVFSCYIWNVTEIKKLITVIKKLAPHKLVFCGGPEASTKAEEFLLSCPVDFVVMGEVESSYEKLVTKLQKWVMGAELPRDGGEPVSFEALKKDLSDCPNLAFLFQGEFKKTAQTKPVAMTKVLFPYDEEELKALTHRLIYYEGQRGCPYGCTYCLSSADRSLRTKSLAVVKEELKVFMKAGVPLVKLVDRTFNAKEAWAFELCSFLIQQTLAHDYKTSFHFEVAAGSLSPRLVDLFCTCPKGLFQIEAGIQSTNPKILHLIDRLDDVAMIKENIRKIVQAGRIHVHTDLIAGLPGEDLDSFQKSFNEALAMRPAMLQLGFLKVLAGTPLAKEQERFGIVHRPWPPYEVLKTKTLSFEELSQIKGVERVLDLYYNSGRFPTLFRFLLTDCNNPWELFLQISKKLKKFEQKNGPIGIKASYELIHELVNLRHPDCRDFITDIMRFDYILTHRQGAIPEHLIDKDYNSRRVSLSLVKDGLGLLKGNVIPFKMDILQYSRTGKVIEKPFWLFYSQGTSDLWQVEKIDTDHYEPLERFS